MNKLRQALFATSIAIIAAASLVGLSSWTPGAQVARAAQRLVWQHDLHSGMDSARKGNKFVLIDLYTDWCGWCKKLDRDTYTDASVVDLLNNQFVCVKLDAEDGGEGESFARQHKVRGFPCIMVLDASGKVRGTSYGYRSPQDFSELVRGMIGSDTAQAN